MANERRIIEQHQAMLRQVRERVVQFASNHWTGLGSWRDADIDRFVAAVAPVVESGQKQVGALTYAYLDTIARANGLVPVASPPVAVGEALRGVPVNEVYRRPAVTTYTALSQGKPLETAVQEGLYRLTDIVTTDMQLAQTRAAQSKLSADKRVVGYRRVLTGFESCALCAIASTQRYHKRDLMPIHPGCDCTVSPIYGDSDPGQIINEDRYLSVMDKLSEQGVTDTHTFTGKNRDLANIVVREHGEYGPTLTWRDQKFTGPADI